MAEEIAWKVGDYALCNVDFLSGIPKGSINVVTSINDLKKGPYLRFKFLKLGWNCSCFIKVTADLSPLEKVIYGVE